ncbi:MAG: HEPN domain-containing protein [Actinobacteria bacterium]|nr:HEPN domain-containing protein [Actinomycetota bacterium]
MIYKDLVAEGKLKKEKAIGIDQIHRFIKRAKKDLETAKLIVENDAGAALTLVYNAMFHAANALIRYQGYRPGNKLQHIGIIEAVSRTLWEDFEAIIFKFDKLRIKRNKFEYQAIHNISKTQLISDIKDASTFIQVIEKLI